MALSVFDLFKIGIGPSSSHTVGPMWAAHRFLGELEGLGLIDRAERVRADLLGSLALTGKGHATDRAVLLGLSGETPDRVDRVRTSARSAWRVVGRSPSTNRATWSSTPTRCCRTTPTGSGSPRSTPTARR